MKYKEVIKILKVARPTIYSYVKKGKIRATKINHSLLDYNEEDVFKVAGITTTRGCAVYARSLNEDKINELINNKKIVRNKLKIKSSINNAIIFRDVVKEYGCFYNYIKTFTGGKIFYEWDRTTNDVSDKMSADLIKRGMKFVGSTIIYSYLQAVGVIYSHMEDCFMFKSR